MSAQIIDIRTRKTWSAERVERAQRRTDALHHADCTAPFYELIFLDPEDETYASDLLKSPHPRTQ